MQTQAHPSNGHSTPMSDSPSLNQQMLMLKHLAALDQRTRHELLQKRTSSGFTLGMAVISGTLNLDSGVGAYAGDAEAYDMFEPFFGPLIADYHGFTGNHVTDFDVNKIPTDPVDPTGEAIVSTRIRVGRNLKGYPLAPMITKEQRLEIMERAASTFKEKFTGDLAGDFYPLEGMDENVRQQLVNDHFLFKQGDRFLEVVGANHDWPSGRGIFHNADKTALVWTNEEDQFRIISMQKGGDIRQVFDRLARMVAILNDALPFAYHEKYGAITSCPTNLGTAMRASVHVKLPYVSSRPDFKQLAQDLRLSIRGIHGEHSESEGGVYDISNKRRLGVSEVEAVLTMYEGIKRLLEIEREMAAKSAA
jgi:arginine kinase